MIRTWFKRLGVVLTLVVAWGMTPNVAAAGVSGTAHDLSASAPSGQLCIACHTPHHANTTLLLWNHVLSTNTFSWSDATETSSGTTLPTNISSWSGSSKNCLSCHDGTVEVGKIYSTGSSFDTNKVGGSFVIGPDLADNHPVAVPYPYGGVNNKYNGITAVMDTATLAGYKASPANVKIFKDPAGGTNNRGIECASCHNPHEDVLPSFLRDALTGSAICLNCHDK